MILSQQIGGPFSIGVPLGAVWAYYGYWLNRHIEAMGDGVRQASMKRLYNYILAFIGLVVAFVGVATLFSFIIDMLTGSGIVLSDAFRSNLAAAISSLIVGLPLWLAKWRPMQAEALAPGEMGDHARRSVLRKTYLYLALFASVIGGMATAVGLVYQLIRIVLAGGTGSIVVNDLLNLVQLLFLFGVVLVYHLSVLRADGASTADSLAEKQSGFKVWSFISGDGFAQSVKAALMKFAPKAPVTVTAVSEKPEGDFNAIVLNGSLAATVRQSGSVRLMGAGLLSRTMRKDSSGQMTRCRPRNPFSNWQRVRKSACQKLVVRHGCLLYMSLPRCLG